MSEPEAQFASAERARRDAEAREAYLRNQQAIAAVSVDVRRWTPMRVATMAAGLISIGLFVATVVSYYDSRQQDGPSNVALPTAVTVAVLVTVLLGILPYLLEPRTASARVRNIAVAAVIMAVLGVLGVPVFVELCSLVADLVFNVTR
jgi:hypothetical protein